ncbi:hypothetical protein Syun_011999 [Stephania yunnanensis]|uniref:Uncharacterized protein n=1 Tax=Stephania yunnanensis TaxID=152371 RepID=A0AAP0PH31_9MAGN
MTEDSFDGGLQESSSDLGAECGNTKLMSDILLQLSTLCNANFISKGGTRPLEASTQYRSTVTEELNLKVMFLIFLLIIHFTTFPYVPPFSLQGA